MMNEELPPTEIRFRRRGRPEESVRLGPDFRRVAFVWSYVAQSRQRWVRERDVRQRLNARAVEELEGLGLARETLSELTEPGLVEVSISYDPLEPQAGLEARMLPWEFLLSAAGRCLHKDQGLTVVRHLEVTGEPPSRPSRRRLSVLLVESGPAEVGRYYTFEGEQLLIRQCFRGLDDDLFGVEDRPGPVRLRKQLANLGPSIVHFTGVDTHEGAKVLHQEPSVRTDGLILYDDAGGAVAVDSTDVARLLTSGDEKPLFVAFNAFNTAINTAAATVASGAHAALGFQDTFDNDYAETFFRDLYEDWQRPDANLIASFQHGLDRLREESRVAQATGIVLWLRSSITADDGALSLPAEKPPAALDAPSGAEAPSEAGSEPRVAVVAEDGDAPDGEGALLAAFVSPHPHLNYCLLHNDRPLFRKFQVQQQGNRWIDRATVEVTLQVGGNQFTSRGVFAIEKNPQDLREHIKVPLTWTQTDQFRENVHTCLDVSVRAGGHEIYQRPLRVTLLPIDEWRDDNQHRQYLPSFVLPRDPAVERILQTAERFLSVLQDRDDAAFDGYQQESSATASGEPTVVDEQVRAIWAALSFRWSLTYINPPPSFSEGSQRIRTPSEVLRGQRGTCLDLALLLAACIEYVDIDPVIFLLRGHAFVGYWRSRNGLNQLIEDPRQMQESLTEGQVETSREREPDGWVLEGYEEVLALIHDGQLVPIETVSLTLHEGFGTAIGRGMKDLRSKADFEALLDVRQARKADVTPLPIGGQTLESAG